VITSINNCLNEVKRTSISRITRKTKINRAVGSLSSAAAKKANDPLYKKMMFHRSQYRKYKEQLMKKYKYRVIAKARK